MRVLVLTKIFPNALEPSSSPFNRQQLAALRARPEIEELEVVVAIPWLPGGRLTRRWSRAGRLIDLPARDVIDGIPVENARVAYLPRVGDAIAPELYGASVLPALLRRRGRFDVLLGAWAYPDGVAAIELARLLHLPAVVKAHGSDLHVLAERPLVRARLRRALPRVAALVAPSRALLARAIELGVPEGRATLLPNGVDVRRFHPRDRAAARARLGLPAVAPLVVCVGRVERAKGTFELLAALPALRAAHPTAEIVFVGGGPDLERARALAARLGGGVRLVGPQPHEAIPEWLAAADLVTLPSWSEGTPNVVLEALACGRRVVATRVGGVPDLLEAASAGARHAGADADAGAGADADVDAVGALVEPRAKAPLAQALVRLLACAGPPPDSIVARARVGSWDESAKVLSEVLAAAVARGGAGGGAS